MIGARIVGFFEFFSVFNSVLPRVFLALCGWTLILYPSCALSQGFKSAEEGYTFSFPRDHGSHPDYHLEWWYYTGHLYELNNLPFRDRPRYGFQLTFFRRSDSSTSESASEYLAHAALTDLESNKTYFASRIGGGSLGLAAVSGDSLGAKSGDWSVDPIGKRLVLRFSILAPNQSGALSVPIEVRILTSELPEIWLQGVSGFSRKAECVGCASMYYSIPRIELSATVRRLSTSDPVKSEELHGIAWMDHEFMTNSLSRAQVGWDWLGLMLKDGRSVVLFQLRNQHGQVDYSSGSIWNSRGLSKPLSSGDFKITPLTRWRSPASGVEYPVEWRVAIPGEGIDTVVTRRVEQCEVGSAAAPSQINSSNSKGSLMRYWEGPVASSDESVLGYLEMTGYEDSLTNQLRSD